MKFDAISFLQDYNISYTEHHSILTSSYAGLDICPFCGATGKPYSALRKDGNAGFSCWICHETNFFEAIKLLTGINDYHKLQTIYKKYGDPSGNYSVSYSSKSDVIRPTKLELPGTTDLIPQARKYLESRGYSAEYVWERYSLRSTVYESRVPYRIVIPIIFNNRVVSYTARSYVKGVEPRYMSCRGDDEVIPHKEVLYNIDNAKRKNVVLVEGGGPDVWSCGDNFVSSFGTEVTLQQRMLLAEKFDNIFVLFDSMESEAQRHAQEVAITLESVGKNCEIIEFDEPLDPADFFFKYPNELIYLKKELGV